MAGSGSPKPNKPIPPRSSAKDSSRKPLQVMHISRKSEEGLDDDPQSKKTEGIEQLANSESLSKTSKTIKAPFMPPSSTTSMKEQRGNVLADEEKVIKSQTLTGEGTDSTHGVANYQNISSSDLSQYEFQERIVDDFDFDEDEFLAALNENEPIGNTGEIVKGKVIAVESDCVYVDIGGKAPGYMPKKEAGLGVITNLKERFPKDLEVEVLVTREQNADGMVTISCRALALRKSWDKVKLLEKEGAVVAVKINGFNRGGVTCDLEGLRAFIPRSQLNQGADHQSLVGKTLSITFLEVNPDTRKLVLSEKKAAIAKRFAELKIGQLIEGIIISIKPYGFFVDLGGVSALLHQSVITNGSLRSLTEVFNKGEHIKAIITDLDPQRGRIGLNTALLEGPPGEIILEKEKVMSEAEERALKAQTVLKPKEESSLG
tara:strand:+ start:723 stop:2015 length:1293 start_codon:yes stop_codon:yes gene_type:complete